MPTKTLSALSVMLTIQMAANAAQAADLAAQGRIGAIFAERPVVVAARRAPVVVTVVDVPWVRTSPKVPGYYGTRGDFFYKNYYGTPDTAIFDRLPYACGLYGLC